jgi:hypothetical protein
VPAGTPWLHQEKVKGILLLYISLLPVPTQCNKARVNKIDQIILFKTVLLLLYIWVAEGYKAKEPSLRTNDNFWPPLSTTFMLDVLLTTFPAKAANINSHSKSITPYTKKIHKLNKIKKGHREVVIRSVCNIHCGESCTLFPKLRILTLQFHTTLHNITLIIITAYNNHPKPH